MRQGLFAAVRFSLAHELQRILSLPHPCEEVLGLQTHDCTEFTWILETQTTGPQAKCFTPGLSSLLHKTRFFEIEHYLENL